jgi:hypothetical protein
MRGERQLLRLGECLVRGASRQLPRKVRDERYREWSAELPVILNDPEIRFAPGRAIRMIAYAADTFRGTTLTVARSRRRRRELIRTVVLTLMLVACLALIPWNIWDITRAPGQPANYLQLAWGLLLAAWQISMLVRPAARATMLIIATASAMGVAVNFWNAARGPADWVNYLCAGSLAVSGLVLWFVSRRTRTRRGNAAREQV